MTDAYEIDSHGAVYPKIVAIPEHPEVAPSVLILKISNEVSFLKEFFQVAVYMQNMAEPQFVLKNSEVKLNLPEVIRMLGK